MQLNCKQCQKMLMNSVCLSVVPIDFQDGVNDFHVGVNESICFFFVCCMTHMNACPKVLLNVD